MPSPATPTDALPLPEALALRPPGPNAGLPPWHAGRQLLIHQPDGPLGGTFSCTRCPAQAWQPDLLQHATDCPFRPPPLPVTAR